MKLLYFVPIALLKLLTVLYLKKKRYLLCINCSCTLFLFGDLGNTEKDQSSWNAFERGVQQPRIRFRGVRVQIGLIWFIRLIWFGWPGELDDFGPRKPGRGPIYLTKPWGKARQQRRWVLAHYLFCVGLMCRTKITNIIRFTSVCMPHACLMQTQVCMSHCLCSIFYTCTLYQLPSNPCARYLC